MIDISKWQEPIATNSIPDMASFVMLRLMVCTDNNLRRSIKGLKPEHVIYYQYDFENDEDIILSGSDQ